MRTITTLEEFLEPDEITWGAVDRDSGSKKRIEELGYGRGSVAKATAGRNKGAVPADTVWDWIRPHKIRSKSPGCDLEVA